MNQSSPHEDAAPVALLLDDVEDIVAELLTMFTLRGIPCAGAHSLREALAKLRALPSISLVISDIRLRDEAGEDMITLVKMDPDLRQRDFRFVFMTGDVMRFAGQDTIEDHPILLKPVHPQRLLELVKGILAPSSDGQ